MLSYSRSQKHLLVGLMLFITLVFWAYKTSNDAQTTFAATTVDDIIVMPRNYIFTWGSSGQGIWVNNTVHCSANPDHTRVIYWRTNDTVPNAGVNDWNPNIPVAGNYDIYVYIPSYTHGAPITTQAKYYFNGGLLTTIDQNQNKCQWVYLGRRWMNAGTGDTISMPAPTPDNPYRLIAGDGMKFVYVPPAPSPPTVFSGNVSSKLFFDNNGERINLEVCANNLPGQLVKAQLSRPGHTFNVVSLPASGRCVIFWDMDGPGPVLNNTTYTTRAALNQNPNSSWPTPCYVATGGQGLCDAQTYQQPPSSSGYKLPYPGGVSHYLTRINHSSGPAFDFATPLNTDNRVVAARAGRVIQVKQNSTAWGCHSNYVNSANYITIRHDDNSIAYYVHLRKDGAVVQVNQMVQRGQLLGYTGLSGYMCGADPRHLHFAVNTRQGGPRVAVAFEDTNNAVPAIQRYHVSGNYMATLLSAASQSLLSTDLFTTSVPEGHVQFRLSNSGSHEIKLLAYDYTHDITHMRLANSEASLETSPWIPYAGSALWSESQVYVQYRTSDGRLSPIYSDVIAPTAQSPIQPNFSFGSSEVCVGEEINLYNLTVPYCPQCAWQWDFGDGHTTSQALNPTDYLNNAWWEDELPDYDIAYFNAGTYTVSLNVINTSSNQTVSKQITVIDSASADFSIRRFGNTIFVEAADADAVSWEWDFGDGTTANGRTASHTYDDLSQQAVVWLTVQSPNGCTGKDYQFVQDLYVYLPFVTR